LHTRRPTRHRAAVLRHWLIVVAITALNIKLLFDFFTGAGG
jgi:hypothetical protein